MTYVPGTASDSWYSEEKFYNYETGRSNDPDQQIGHFTAMIWKSATKVGFAYTVVPQYNADRHSGYAIYVIADYAPDTTKYGNHLAGSSMGIGPDLYRSQYAENVPKKI